MTVAGLRCFVAGDRGLVDSAIVRRLAPEGCENLMLAAGEETLLRGFVNDTSKPDGRSRKLLDTGRLCAVGPTAAIRLRHRIAQTYEWCQLLRLDFGAR